VRIPLLDLKRAVAEQALLQGRFIDNVYQCGPRTFLLKLKPETLLIDLEPNRARVVVTEDPPPVPSKPPVFGSILRTALRGGRLAGISLLGEDRIVAIDVDCDGPRRVVVEAFARHGNLLLLDADGTVERVLDGDAARHRGNPVGARYALPAAPRIPPEEASLLPRDLPATPFAANHALDHLARAESKAKEQQVTEKAGEKLLERLRKAIAGVERDIGEVPDPKALRKQGELLLVHYGELRQGMKAFQGIALDPRHTPQESVDRVFEAARKAERARPALQERLEELKGLLGRAEAGEALPEALASRKGEPHEPRRPYKVFQSADGRRILVGKGGRDNDETTLKVAGPHDLFLHTRGCPGAHVIVPLDRGEEVPEQTLLDAATLALHYSKMRTAAAGEISYTPRRHVSKPKGAKPGLVQISHEKVIRLRRELDRLARLLMSAE